MPTNPEVREIVDFVSSQRAYVRNNRQFRRRIRFFGFTVLDTDDGPMIAKLPRKRVVCPLPAHLNA